MKYVTESGGYKRTIRKNCLICKGPLNSGRYKFCGQRCEKLAHKEYDQKRKTKYRTDAAFRRRKINIAYRWYHARNSDPAWKAVWRAQRKRSRQKKLAERGPLLDVCIICGFSFPKMGTRKTCSMDCRGLRRQQMQRARYWKNHAYLRDLRAKYAARNRARRVAERDLIDALKQIKHPILNEFGL